MQRIAFLASFFAVFLTLDNHLYDGAITRYAWHVVNGAANDAEAKISGWARRN